MQHGEIDGTRLPGMPQGLNQFQHYDCFVMLSALCAPTNRTSEFLQDMTGMTERQIRRRHRLTGIRHPSDGSRLDP